MFTIIIPTYERHNIFLRSIDYYKHFNCNVVIADSSAKKFNHELPDNISYRYLPGLGCGEKIFEVAKDITTPYVCLSPDDDYLVESSLQVGARFLDDNLDYVSVQGRYLCFALIENQVIFSPKYSRQISHYAATSEDRFSRMVRAYNPCMAHFYAIHRTDVFIKSFQLTADVSALRITEFVQPLVPMCYGKHKVLPILWMARDTYTSDPIRRQRNLTETAKLGPVALNYMRFNRFVSEIENFLDSEEGRLIKKKFGNIISELVNNSRESDKLFDAAFKSLIKHLINDRNKVIMKIIIKSFVPTWMLKYYKTNKTLRHMGGVETTSSAKDALNKIRLSVLTFSKYYDRQPQIPLASKPPSMYKS